MTDRSAGGRSAEAGFSVLEAIVAVALLGVALMPLLALQGQMTRTVIAIERREAATRDMTSALGFLRSINPAETPSGETPMGEARLIWEAQPATPERPVLDQGGAPGRFVAQLFDVEARLVYPDGRVAPFEIRLMGWRAVRPVGDLG